MKYKLFYIFLIMLCFGISTISYRKYLIREALNDQYWSVKKRDERLPAEAKISLNRRLLQDYFLFDDFNHTVSYEIRPSFTTNEESNPVAKSIHQLLRQSFAETLMILLRGTHTEKNFSGILKENFENKASELLQKKNLFKNTNPIFTLNVEFHPHFNPEITYQKNLSFQNFLDVEDVEKEGQLYQKLQAPNSQLKEIARFAKTIVNNGYHYQYMGGLIQTSLKPHFGLSDEHHTLSGKILFRRYFRINDLEKLKLRVETPQLKTIVIKFQKIDKEKPGLMTVDINRNFDLFSNKTQASTIDISVGLLKSPKENAPDFNSGNFIFYGHLIHPETKKKVSFKSRAVTLSYDLKDQSFNHQRSIFETQLLRPEQYEDVIEKISTAKIKELIKTNILSQLKTPFIEETGLADLIEDFESAQ